MGAFETASCAKLLIPRNFKPGALLSALGNGFAEDELVMTGGESWERPRRFEIAGVEIGVKILEELDEGVGIAFRVSARIRGVATRCGAEQRRIFDERLVGFFAAANPKRVGIFGVPGERTFAAVHFEAEAAFAAGADLRNAVKAAQIVFKVDEDARVVVG